MQKQQQLFMYFLSYANNQTSICESSLYPRLSFTAETFAKDICFELKTIKCQIVQRLVLHKSYFPYDHKMPKGEFDFCQGFDQEGGGGAGLRRLQRQLTVGRQEAALGGCHHGATTVQHSHNCFTSVCSHTGFRLSNLVLLHFNSKSSMHFD